MPEPELALALVGFGHVGQRFVQLLDELADRIEFRWRLVAVGTARHGSVIAAEGIDARRAIALREAGEPLDRLDAAPTARSGIDIVRQVAAALGEEAADGRLVVVETTTLDIDGGEPAVAHVRAALESFAHVVTANKGPAAFAYDELADLARAVERWFLFEGAVMDGVPVFNLVRETMPAVGIDGFRGIINTTCQYALAEMERGVALDDAIREMQGRGIAEADASHDVDGWDAAAKTAALANVLMGARVTPHDVARVGIRDIAPDELAAEGRRGRRVRLVASANRRHGRIEARVEPEVLDAGDPLATLGPLENALYLRTDVLGEIGIVQRGSSLTQTAYALVSDLTRISRALQALA